MKTSRPHRFPPLTQLASLAGAPAALPARAENAGGDPGYSRMPQHLHAHVQATLAEGFQQGMDRGYQEGLESGLRAGRQEGLDAGLAEGLRQGRDQGHAEGLARFERLAQPIDKLFSELQQVQADYQSALRTEVVDLVAKVARQVIRSELALQPVQLLALVDETLAAMPPAADGVEVYLNPEECQRIKELAPERAARWSLIPDARLEAGECRVRAGDREVDAGCRQRLSACMDKVREQLVDAPLGGSEAIAEGEPTPTVEQPAPLVEPATETASAEVAPADTAPAPRRAAATKTARAAKASVTASPAPHAEPAPAEAKPAARRTRAKTAAATAEATQP